MELPEDASSAQTFQAIRAAVAQGFEIGESSLPALKYKDEEGDLCTLVEASVDDMLELSKGGTLRLCMSKAPEKVAQEETASPVLENLPAAASVTECSLPADGEACADSLGETIVESSESIEQVAEHEAEEVE